MAEHLELSDMQRLIVDGYARRPHSRYALLAVRDGNAAAARAWIASVLPQLGRAHPRHEDDPCACRVNLAFTHEGLDALGLTGHSGFLAPFREGMSRERRSRQLGDVGDSAPSEWCWGGPRNETIHVLLMLFSAEGRRDEDWQELEAGLGWARVIRRLDGYASDREHFGFHDGISQPYIEGSDTSRRPMGRYAEVSTVKPGEFILGYLNEVDTLPTTPTVPAALDPGRLLEQRPTQRARRDFGRNGSYLVLRQLRQHVEVFNDYLKCAAKGNPEKAEWIAAKLVGRWRSGAPLVRAPVSDVRGLEKDNDFGFFESDRLGHACPIGAHIRRANPRDSLVSEKLGVGPERAADLSRRRRLIRRGRLYDDAGEQGLLFLCLNASIQNQFEFVQNAWINGPSFAGLRGETDPLIGPRTNGECAMTLQAPGGHRRLEGLPGFVDVRGGGYFFLPGIKALEFLAALPGA